MKTLVRVLCLVVMIACFSACSNDEPTEPSNTAELNMLNVDNGKTKLGKSDVYIDEANNFHSEGDWYLSDAGKVGNLGANGVFDASLLESQVRVIPGHLYYLIPKSIVRTFPSGKNAVLNGSKYYKLYVTSEIKNGNEVMGAVVRFAETILENKALYKSGTIVGTIDSDRFAAWENKSLKIPLPVDGEYMKTWNNDEALTVSEDNGQIIFRAGSNAENYTGVLFDINLRSGYIFTIVNVRLLKY